MTRYILRGLTMPLEYELHSGLNTVGRNPTNELRISEASVSSFHAELTVLEDETVIVRDLQSTNGTFVDGQPVEEAAIQAGQAVQFGSIDFRLDAEEYEIRVPTAPGAEPARAAGVMTVLEDGRPACSRNPQLPATHVAVEGCQAVVKCPGLFNLSSLRAVKLSGGTAGVLLFCPDCNAKCQALPGATDQKKKESLFSRMTQTIRLGWKK